MFSLSLWSHEGPFAANQYLRFHQHRAIMRVGLFVKITDGGLSVCMHVVYMSLCVHCAHLVCACVYMCLFVCACVCLCLLSLIIGHRPDSHQVLS